jgi:hypothetical protein
MKKITLVLLLTLLLTGCAVNRFNGTWEGDMVSIGGEEEGISCGSATLSLIIGDGNLGGKAIVNYGYELTVSGTINENGKIEGELIGDDDAEVFFSGELLEKTGGGTWNDRLKCSGTFGLAKK